MQEHIYRWRVQKCKAPSTRWVAWRVKQKKRTGEVFDSWSEAFIYASYMAIADKAVASLRSLAL